MEVFIHPRVKKYLDESGEKEGLIKHLKKLTDNSYNKRSGADVRRLKGKKHDMHRVRVGDYRFEYFIDEGKVWIDNAFKRGGSHR